MPLPDLQQEDDLHMSLSHKFAPQPSTVSDITKDFLVSANPPTRFNHSCELRKGEEFESTSEFHEHHNFE